LESYEHLTNGTLVLKDIDFGGEPRALFVGLKMFILKVLIKNHN
jgi:hypothetical protein